MSPKKSSSTYTRTHGRKIKDKSPLTHVTIPPKLGIIRSQTWFTPCSSLIVLKSSVTRSKRRKRRLLASKYTCALQAGAHTQTYTIGPDRGEDTKEARSLGAAFSICWG